MAKSIRSKWKRKCRAVKRERYAVKELARLQKMLGVTEEKEKKSESEVMESEQVIFLDAGEVTKKKKKNKKKAAVEEDGDVQMSSDDEAVEVKGEKGQKVFSSKTLRDQNGQYPIWLHKRKQTKMNNAIAKKKIKRSKKKRR